MSDQEQSFQITKVISLGNEQRYLTYSQINDLLPNIVDTEHFDVIISMLEGMNIKVYEQPPSDDELALLLSTEEVPDIEEAAMVLASVDKETGRTTDPVRMYMREMGTVELLTREGEIRIAKRIEEGIYQVLRSLAHYPETVQLVLDDYERFLGEEIRLNEIISGFADSDEEIAPAANIGSMLDDEQQDEVIIQARPVVTDEEDEDGEGEGGLAEVDDGPNPEIAKGYFDELRENFNSAMDALREHGRTNPKTIELLDKMSDSFLKLKLT
ncbi:MAG: RNA polymerase sigma factor RpoD, partial [Legionella sp.]